MKIVSCLFLMIFAFATLNSIMRLSSFEFEKISYKETQQKDLLTESTDKQQVSYDSVNIEQLLGVLFHDLTNEGLKKPTQRNAIFMTNDNNADPGIGPSIVSDYNMELVSLSDLEKQKKVIDNSVDFVFTTDFPAASKFIERTLKVDGVVAFLARDNPSAKQYKPSNYKMVYVRRLDLIAVAMIKKEELVRHDQPPPMLAAPRKLLGYSSEAKKAALQNLEDVLLEPPRASSRISRKYLKRTKYLPNLMGDSLESYPRRVFIDVELAEKEGERKNDWFQKNYPTRNKNFEIYNINIEIITADEEASTKEVPQIGMSDWMRKNVKDEEFVVMKAEAEVVEEMIKRDTIGLVDELFLECKPHKKQENNRSRRAYWECLALYGNLRDKGVAVHQWWG
ncbi:uncharacterized protein LOC107477324 [Arachis duranensis]|nr:uncharacterized protein LOC107477324 [Arachis duranensis]